MSRGYSSELTSVHFLGYHFVWCPKYRKAILTDNIATRCEALIREKASELKCEILALEIMPDHVHLFITGKPVISPHDLIAQIKGYSSRMLRLEHPEIQMKIPSLWTRSYFVSSHGHVSAATIAQYIKEQKGV